MLAVFRKFNVASQRPESSSPALFSALRYFFSLRSTTEERHDSARRVTAAPGPLGAAPFCWEKANKVTRSHPERDGHCTRGSGQRCARRRGSAGLRKRDQAVDLGRNWSSIAARLCWSQGQSPGSTAVSRPSARAVTAVTLDRPFG